MEMEKNMEKVEDHEEIRGMDETKIIDIEVDRSNLELLKESYLVLEKEYSLVPFDEMNRDFSIEKIHEEDTDYLIREVRRFVSEKFSTYLRFIETLLQPSNAQMFVFSMLKTMNSDDMEMLKTNYKKLARKEIDVIELDLNFDLEKEVAFVNSAFSLWQEVKTDLLDMMQKVKNNWNDNGDSSSKPGNYFG